jgi:hypothetical protein
MARLILMDSGPLGLIVRAPSKPQVVRCLTWLKAISAAGATVIIPEGDCRAKEEGHIAAHSRSTEKG